MLKTGKLRALREKHGLTQFEISRRLNVSQPTYALMESGELELSIDQLFTMAIIFQVHPYILAPIGCYDQGQIPSSEIADANSIPTSYDLLPMNYTLETIARELEERKALVKKLKRRYARQQF